MRHTVTFVCYGLMLAFGCSRARFAPVTHDGPTVVASISEEVNGDNASELPDSPDNSGTADANPIQENDTRNSSDETSTQEVDQNEVTIGGPNTNHKKDQKSSQSAKPSSSSGKNHGKNTSHKPADTESDSDSDEGACAKAVGVPLQKLKIAGRAHVTQVSSGEALLVRLTGNSNTLNLKLTSPGADAKISGLCLFVAGRQGKIKLESEANIGVISIKERGNQPQVIINLGENAAVDRMKVDLKGNHPTLTIQASDGFDCAKVSGPGITCQP